MGIFAPKIFFKRGNAIDLRTRIAHMAAMDTQTDMMITIITLLACGVIGTFAFHMGSREHNSTKPRMMPWMVIAFGCAATALMVLVHLVNLLGFETGRGLG